MSPGASLFKASLAPGIQLVIEVTLLSQRVYVKIITLQIKSAFMVYYEKYHQLICFICHRPGQMSSRKCCQTVGNESFIKYKI